MQEMFARLLACTRAMSLYYQHIHWSVKNTISFQDHLLAERLYGEVNAEIDGIAEKSIGVIGNTLSINLQQNLKNIEAKLATAPMIAKENSDFFKAALALEKEFIQYCTEYEKTPGITLGFKNQLADLADHAESRVYLLQQRLMKG